MDGVPGGAADTGGRGAGDGVAGTGGGQRAPASDPLNRREDRILPSYQRLIAFLENRRHAGLPVSGCWMIRNETAWRWGGLPPMLCDTLPRSDATGCDTRCDRGQALPANLLAELRRLPAPGQLAPHPDDDRHRHDESPAAGRSVAGTAPRARHGDEPPARSFTDLLDKLNARAGS